MIDDLSPYPLFLNALPLEQLPDDELEEFAFNLAAATRESIYRNEETAQIECWVRHWARAESERQRRGFEPETLLDRVN